MIKYFTKDQLALGWHKIQFCDKYCLDSMWIDENFPFPSVKTIDSLMDDLMKRNPEYVIGKAFNRLSAISYISECLDLESKAIREFLTEKDVYFYCPEVETDFELPFPEVDD